MKKILYSMFLAGWMSLAGMTGLSYGDMSPLTNGDFSDTGVPPDPFAEWATTYGEAPTDGGGFALFSESRISSQTELEQSFNIPSLSGQLSFEFALATDPNGSGGVPPDSFQATLFDLSFNPFPTPTDPLFPAFYSIDATGQEFYDSSFVSVIMLPNNWRRVTLELSSFAPHDVFLEFLLNGSEDARNTTVSLDNVAIHPANAVPEPRMIGSLIAAQGFLWIASRRRRRPRLGTSMPR